MWSFGSFDYLNLDQKFDNERFVVVKITTWDYGTITLKLQSPPVSKRQLEAGGEPCPSTSTSTICGLLLHHLISSFSAFTISFSLQAVLAVNGSQPATFRSRAMFLNSKKFETSFLKTHITTISSFIITNSISTILLTQLWIFTFSYFNWYVFVLFSTSLFMTAL